MTTADDGPQPFVLTHQEKQSGLWSRLADHLRERRDIMRAQNDGALGPIETANLRGQIQELTRLINLGKDMPPIEED